MGAQQGFSSAQGSLAGSGERLLLAIHAPKRQIIEVWEAPHGVRLCSLKAGPDCLLVPAAPVFGGGQAPHVGSRRAGGSPAPSRSGCWALECTHGWLWSLDDAVRAALLE